MSKSARLIFLLLLLIAFAIRLGLALHQSDNLDSLPDQKEYLSIAQNLQQHHSLSFFDPRFGQQVYAYRLPGYPIFLALKPTALPWGITVRIAQILLDLSTIIAVFLIARHLSGNVPTALTAAGWMVFNPFYVYFSSLILSETLFAALVIWGIWFLIRRPMLVGVFLLIASCYVRSTGLMLLPAVVFAAGLNNPTASAYRLSTALWRGIRRAILSSLLLLICMVPWAWRNHNLLDTWVWTTTNSGITLYDGFHAGATGGSDQRFVADLPQPRPISEVERSNQFARSAWQWIGQNPTQLRALELRKLLRGWSPVPLSRDFGKPVYRLISVSYALPFDVFCVIGLFSRRIGNRAKILIVTPAVVVTLAQLMTVGSIRYRMPAEAPLAVIAGVGLIDFAAKIRMTKYAEHK